MNLPIVDLHCDLLSYLEKDRKRTPYDQAVRCAIPQLRQGNVKLQTMAIFAHTETHCAEKGLRQAHLYQQLLKNFPQEFIPFSSTWNPCSSSIATLIACENASVFCNEEEPLEEGFKRLHAIIQTIAKPLYISLTWNTENRFGGGAFTSIGLKKDGKLLLEEIDHQKIAIDLSHASDALAYEVIDYIEGHGLDIPLAASHSNARAINPVARNLPDEIAQEIFRRRGWLGLNFYRHFVGEKEEHFLKHVTHWLELGGEDCVAFGADFFYDLDFPSRDRMGQDAFFKKYADASCYPRLLSFLKHELKLQDVILEKLAFQNVLSFLNRLASH